MAADLSYRHPEKFNRMIEEVRKEFAGVKGMVKGFSGSGTRQLAVREKKRDLAAVAVCSRQCEIGIGA